MRMTSASNNEQERGEGEDGAAASRSIGFANVPEPSLEKKTFFRVAKISRLRMTNAAMTRRLSMFRASMGPHQSQLTFEQAFFLS